VRGAGIALAVGILIAIGVTRTAEASAVVVVVGFTSIGVWDDLRSPPAGVRLCLQLIVAAVAAAFYVWGGVASFWLAALGALLIAATTNSVNFMDGINGISAMHAVLWGCTFAWILASESNSSTGALALALAGAGLAFIPWNAWTAHAFLGDSGSYLIGGVVGLLALAALVAEGPIVALCPLAIYATDTALTVIRRIRAGEKVSVAHREHVYQRLLRRGWSHQRTAGVTTAFSAACSLIAVAAVGRSQAGQSALLTLAVLVSALYTSLPTLSELRARA
jgi:UDP-N-acetylmuramyl pentapeptide phosphotransferase/UDP-N-acetylglucosamine-1-phosphate transferase